MLQLMLCCSVQISEQVWLTLKALSKIVADSILLIIFQRKYFFSLQMHTAGSLWFVYDVRYSYLFSKWIQIYRLLYHTGNAEIPMLNMGIPGKVMVGKYSFIYTSYNVFNLYLCNYLSTMITLNIGHSNPRQYFTYISWAGLSSWVGCMSSWWSEG